MTERSESITDFHFGETVEFTIAAKNRDGTTLTSPAGNTLTFAISTSDVAAPVLSFDSSPRVVLTDAGTALWTVRIPASSYEAALTPGAQYRYRVSTQAGTDDPITQAHGLFHMPEFPVL